MAIKRPRGKPGTVVVLEHVSRAPEGQSARRSARAQARRVVAAAIRSRRERTGGARRYPVLFDLAGFTGSGSSHIGWKNFSENCPSARRGSCTTSRWRPAIIVFPGLLHRTRRQPVHQFLRDRTLRRLPDARDRAVRRPRVSHARIARASRLLRQIIRRLRRDRARHEVLRKSGARSRIIPAMPISSSCTGTTGRTR